MLRVRDRDVAVRRPAEDRLPGLQREDEGSGSRDADGERPRGAGLLGRMMGGRVTELRQRPEAVVVQPRGAVLRLGLRLPGLGLRPLGFPFRLWLGPVVGAGGGLPFGARLPGGGLQVGQRPEASSVQDGPALLPLLVVLPGLPSGGCGAGRGQIGQGPEAPLVQ